MKDRRTVSNVPADEIRRIMHRNEVEKFFKDKELPIRRCPVCEEKFEPKSKWQKFCHPKCRNMWHGLQRAIRRESLL